LARWFSYALLFVAFAGICAAQPTTYTYDTAGRLATVTYPNGKIVNLTYDLSGNLLRRQIINPSTGPAPAVASGAVVNAASFLGGAIAPGEMVTIFGSNIGPSKLANYSLSSPTFVDTLTGDTTVYFDGVPAPLIYASAGQTTAIVPYSVFGKSTTSMMVNYQGRSSPPVAVPVAVAAPALFSADSSGKGNGAILNQDNSVNSPSNPAAKGSIVILYGTGEGQTNPAGVDGRIAATVFPKPLGGVKVNIGGQDAQIAYAGAGPFQVAGVFQINVTVPQGVASGAVPVVVTVGTVSSPAGVTASVK
jgi:uncharacterized protein (TIGR03437 family)